MTLPLPPQGRTFDERAMRSWAEKLRDAVGTAGYNLITSDSGNAASGSTSTNITIEGGEGIDTSISGYTLTIAGEDATATNKGIASFLSTYFSTNGGAVDLIPTAIDHDTLTNYVANQHINWTSTTSNFSTSGTVATGVITVTGSVIFNGSTSGTTTVIATAIAGTTTLTLPAATDTLVGKATTDTFTNKSGNISQWTNDSGYITATLTQEQVEDYAGALVATGGTKTGITVTYQDATNNMDFVVSDEFISDTVGTMVTGNTETGITVTYQDADNTLDFVVDTATTTAAGIAELATTAETTTGTDTGRVIPVSALPLQIQDSKYVYAADAGASDTYVITLAPAPAAYATGQVFHFKANTVNTGAATLNVNSLGAKTIVKHNDQTLADGDIEANQIVTVVYDGTNFQMQSQLGNAPSGSLTAATQAEQETGTSTSVYVSPGRQQYHVSASKAWIYLTYSGGTPTATVSYNVTSLTDTGTGNAAVNLTTAFSTGNYCVVIAPLITVGNTYDARIGSLVSSSSYSMNMCNTATGAAIDANMFSAAFGDQ